MMQNNNYKVSKLAQAHLRKIKNYTVSNYSENQWRIYKETLLAGFQILADNPAIGKNCDDIYPSGFYFHIGEHTTYYTKENRFILIVAVLGQSQLPQNHL